ncbi:hypothetical protein BRADI_3g34895v3 [Brachypodium distachyon]|uniref:Uncharacterized protein n=1 Tax=Brachypodium distachyon TaxID=15368 RepID=A0A2K2D182_BRADI|nr:hypothetical protein BRADI_3g34895v3 [Brachypodium distachyon]
MQLLSSTPPELSLPPSLLTSSISLSPSRRPRLPPSPASSHPEPKRPDPVSHGRVPPDPRPVGPPPPSRRARAQPPMPAPAATAEEGASAASDAAHPRHLCRIRPTPVSSSPDPATKTPLHTAGTFSPLFVLPCPSVLSLSLSHTHTQMVAANCQLAGGEEELVVGELAD